MPMKISRSHRAKLKKELDLAAKLDAGLGLLIQQLGYPEPRPRAPGFATLLRVIVSQQLSTHVASVIWDRLDVGCGGDVTYRKILNRNDDQLRSYGFSRQKIDYDRELARMIKSKKLNLERMPRSSAARSRGWPG